MRVVFPAGIERSGCPEGAENSVHANDLGILCGRTGGQDRSHVLTITELHTRIPQPGCCG
jgi:hypothetical protein